MDDEIIEIDSDESEINKVLNENNNLKRKKNLKEKWDDLDKKTKVLIILIPILLILLIIVVLLLIFVFNDNHENEDNKNPNDNVVIAKDNYRYENGNLIFLDKMDQIIGSYECNNKDPQLCKMAESNFTKDKFERVMSVNENDEELFLTSNIYFSNYAFIKDGENIYLYNIKNKVKELTLKNIKVYDYASNLVVIADENEKYGLIEIKEDNYNYLIKCIYDNLGIINPKLNYLVAEDKNATYLVDKDGHKISSNINVDIKSVSKDYFVAVDKNEYNLYTLKNEKVLEGYDYISINDNIIALVNKNKLYLRDLDLNKLNEEGITLTNNDYVKKYVYDSNNQLKDTLTSYEINEESNKIIIKIDNEKFNINPYEGKISKNYNYMSYYDGKLYFYSDTSKNELLGNYECSNNNEINSNSASLTKCSIYNNDLGLSGIYNNNYVFIEDDANIYLYDIKNAKIMGTYSELNILNNSEINKNMQLIYTDSSYILAKSQVGNNKNNYGILEITSSKAQGKIEFKYKNITKYNDYYLLVSIDDTYSIYNHDFKKISNEFSYMELYDNYYVAISDNKLNIYKYDDPLGILEEGLEISDNDFTITFDDYFNITIGDKVYKYNFEGSIYE